MDQAVRDIRPPAVVTHGSNGFGHELAKQFAEHGHDLRIAAKALTIGPGVRREPKACGPPAPR